MECFDDGALIYDLDHKHFYEVNCTSRDVLKLVDGRRSTDQIARLIAVQYEMPFAEVQRDIIDLFDRFIEQGIVKQGRARVVRCRR